jgi:hypothetical protein
MKRSTLRIVAALLVFMMIAGVVVAIFAGGSAGNAHMPDQSAKPALL